MISLRTVCSLSGQSLAFTALIFACGIARHPTLANAETFSLSEDRESGVVFRVESRVRIQGTIKTPAGKGNSKSFPIESTGTYRYRERSLPSGGRDALAFRAARVYEAASAKIQVGDTQSQPRLRSGIQFLVAEGRRTGIEFYNPLAKMRRDDLDLLSVPGDSLSVLALLPRTEMEPGEKWNLDDWAFQMLVDIDAVLESNMVCELVSVTGGVAEIQFGGEIRGATVGAATELQVNGRLEFDLSQRFVSRLELTQTEKRQTGAISPGLDVEARVEWSRTPVTDDPDLTTARLSLLPLEPNTEQLQLIYDSPWSVRFNHSRDWHVFHQTPQILILRLVQNGRLISQCNVSPVSAARPGEHTPEEQFQGDIQKSLGERLKEIETAEQLELQDAAGRFVYRVVVAGESSGKKMRWVYYLCAAPSGQQVAFVFAVDHEDIERLGQLHEQIVSSLEFTAGAGKPTAISR